MGFVDINTSWQNMTYNTEICSWHMPSWSAPPAAMSIAEHLVPKYRPRDIASASAMRANALQGKQIQHSKIVTSLRHTLGPIWDLTACWLVGTSRGLGACGLVGQHKISVSSIKSNTAHACSFAHACSRTCACAPTHPPTSWLTCHFLPRRPSPLESAYGASRNNGEASRNCKNLETHEVHEPQGVGLPIPAIMWDTINRRGSKIGLTLQTNMQLLML